MFRSLRCVQSGSELADKVRHRFGDVLVVLDPCSYNFSLEGDRVDAQQRYPGYARYAFVRGLHFSVRVYPQIR
ncbi:hypothetical protein DAPPUDRAFT_257294 [Daphnia pulex]|uniref:Uncharacterized protein n=1 Tax=Daphnia pulex TaxID=6669 RepID=E9HDA2_DAPPU|nr:hypothetical protein DAPPUDRAFT_257294 [Daphnia pulex]|eukprot:EFX70283.1 hypothetical protein DAPPUDRAFT_257294 [Daphnia pulex]